MYVLSQSSMDSHPPHLGRIHSLFHYLLTESHLLSLCLCSLALVPTNPDWEHILAWEQEQRTTLMPPAKPKVPCALLRSNMECKPMSHNIRPFCLASKPFQTDNIIWMTSPGQLIPVCHTATRYYLVTCCSRHVSCPDLAINWLTHYSLPMIFLPITSKSWLEKILREIKGQNRH